MSSFALGWAVRALLAFLAGAAGARLLRARSAALRHLLWCLALAAAVLVGPLSLLLPRIEIRLPIPQFAARPVVAGAAPDVHQAGEAHPWPRPAPAAEARSPAAARTGSLALAGRAALALWGLGAALLLCRSAAGRWRLHRLLAGSRPAADAVAAEAAALARAVGCRRPVPLRVHDAVTAPAAFGVWRPVVVLPPGHERWPRRSRRVVLLHELAHVARRDASTQLLAELACAVHWYDPLAWLAARRLRVERERACDDRVLATGAAPASYAQAIVEMARSLGARGGRVAGALAMGFDQLATRLRAILDSATARSLPSRRERLALTAALALVAGGGAALGLAPAGGRALPLDDPLSERLPAVADLRDRWPDEAEVQGAPDEPAIRRFQAGAARTPQWEGDLVAERSAWALAQVRDGEVVGPLLAALGDPDWRVQAYAAWSLAVAGDRRAIAPVSGLLRHPVWRVRAQAVATLHALGATPGVGELERLAADPAWQVRIGVVEHLARRGAPSARELSLLRALTHDPHAGTRTTAEAALAARRGR